MNNPVGTLLPKHGGYRKLKSFQLAQLVYDITVRFCDLYISKFSRTHDQMVQAARSGVQNIAEGSQASGTSKKTELKLTNVARASLEELKLDYEDYLRQNKLSLWKADDPRRKELVNQRCKTAEEVAEWVRKVHDIKSPDYGRDGLNGHNGPQSANDKHIESSVSCQSQESSQSGQSITSIPSIVSIPSIKPAPQHESYSAIAANAALVLIGVATALLDRQIKTLADKFVKEGGFTEKLYRTRQSNRTL